MTLPNSNVLMGKRLKQLRKDKKITQAELAKNINSSLRMVSAIETAHCNATVQFIKQISLFFGVSTDYILNGSIPISNQDLKLIDMIHHDSNLSSKLIALLNSKEQINCIS